MYSSAFVLPTPSFLKPGSGDVIHKGRHTCPVRATAGTAGPSEEKKDGDEGLSSQRAALEKAFGSELKTSEGRNGQCDCIWCNGTKERRCSWCNGSGVRYELINKSWEEIKDDIARMKNSSEPQPLPEPKKIPVTCSACSGSKKLRCAYCRGSGIGSYGHAY